ncbi:MAG: hypothetical protein ACJAQW_001617 [Paracoccaceae bacterium]|jgi:hypothetical protein
MHQKLFWQRSFEPFHNVEEIGLQWGIRASGAGFCGMIGPFKP